MKHKENFEVVYDGTQTLEVQYASGENFRVRASSETGGPDHEVKTWKWDHEGLPYRVQIQVGQLRKGSREEDNMR